MNFYLTLLFILLSPFTFAESLENIAKSNEWQRLIHSDQNRYDHSGARVKIQALAELKRTVALFQKQAEDKIGTPAQYPECAYISRYLFLKDKIPLPPKRVCPEYDSWINNLNPTGISLVLASPYAHHPASLFGHTFLKIETNYHQAEVKEKNRSELLSYGINYSAITDTDNGIAFAILGLTGGYEGHFSLMPYFLKLNEYSYLESRDLWEYKLTIPKNKLGYLLAHIWELESTGYFKYYFIDENCSYQLLKLIELLYPEIDLTSQFKVFVPPIDTIKALLKYPGLLADINYRPSIFTKVMAHFNQLTSDQQKSFLQVVNQFNATTIQSLTDPQVMDLLIEYLEFKKDKSDLFLLLLRTRAKMGVATTETPITTPTYPHQSHAISKIGTAVITTKGAKPKFAFIHKVGFHDLYNPSPGYPILTELNVLETKIYYQDSRLFFDSLDVINVTALSPNDFNKLNLSWLSNLQFVNGQKNGCDNCIDLQAKMAFGNSYFHSHNHTFALLGGPFFNWGHMQKNFEVGPMVTQLMYGTFTENLKYKIDLSYYLKKENPFNSEVKLIYQLNVNHDLILNFHNSDSVELATNIYF